MKKAKVSKESFNRWLSDYGEAWESGSIDAIPGLFSEEAKYFETPFEKPFEGIEQLMQYWAEGARDSQRDVHFNFDIIETKENIGMARWQATFTRVPSGKKVELDGILLCEFDGTGRCTIFREWWHRREY